MVIRKELKKLQKNAINEMTKSEEFRHWCAMPDCDIFHYTVKYDGAEVLLTSKFNPDMKNMSDDQLAYFNQYGDCDIIMNGEEYKGKEFVWNWLTEKVSYKK